MNDQQIAEVAEQAQLAMWDAITEAFPEAIGGDFPPVASAAIAEAITSAIATWCRANVPQGVSR